MLRFPDQTKDRIVEALETGDAAGTWAYVLRTSRDPEFLPAIRAMLRRRDVADDGKYSAVQYLWNVGTPQAVDVLREAYDRRILSSEPWSWLRPCEALAANGDGRGLPDAFEVLLDLEPPAESPTDEQKRRSWEGERDRRKDQAEAVFGRATKEASPRSSGEGECRLASRAAGRPPAPLAAARRAEAARVRHSCLGEGP